MASVNEIEQQQPLVSVITPTYNRPDYLKDALSSATKQTYQNIEIIVSDNCSPENPQTIVESFNDSRIRFSRNESNLGMLTNTLKAFKMARGKYIACLLDDDMWEPDFLAKLVPPLEANPDLTLAFCDHYMMNAAGEINITATEECTRIYKRENLKQGTYQPFGLNALVQQSVSPAIAAVIRRDIIDWDEFSPEIAGMWDVYLAYLCCRTGKGAYYYPERLTRYREHEQTETMQSGSRNIEAKIRKAKSEIFCYGKFLQDQNLKEFHQFFQQKWLHAHTTLGVGLMRDRQVKQARTYLWQALRQQKFNLRTLVALGISYSPPKLSNRLLSTSK
ncbi:MAG: glycosyltransferase family 2 protein [Methylacidiphilales bacterium]|nr:glycosyltransferase family 2 protein [Candidatus Methylacidiphilales bacterium]NJR15201.1 glycosyltransferase family 2 protein [Calothrix sp. CSU_2_0]